MEVATPNIIILASYSDKNSPFRQAGAIHFTPNNPFFLELTSLDIAVRIYDLETCA